MFSLIIMSKTVLHKCIFLLAVVLPLIWGGKTQKCSISQVLELLETWKANSRNDLKSLCIDPESNSISPHSLSYQEVGLHYISSMCCSKLLVNLEIDIKTGKQQNMNGKQMGVPRIWTQGLFIWSRGNTMLGTNLNSANDV